MSGLEHKVPPPFVLLILALLMWFANHLMGGGVASTMLFYGGLLLLALGFGVAFTSLRTLIGNHTTPSPIEIERAKVLVTSGPYRFTRNPTYLGMLIFLIGVAALFANVWLLAGPVAFALYIQRFQITPEERVMAAKFGADYSNYCAQVRRWI